ncbi:hypothetical protein L228DRAFT_247237 [Xylona heveae TC161]|uniref:Uncharacterized protein n=1 Tax=Xylona heveae (strain CBS 132557 / TC161) TaxID=1328760 RepID=A0A165H0N5_XYLHT|nr:hypothetical protein L228DRAFT_247237 [Xylona heveae TC161]KZF22839.1 hypothetical protein L228DRAFT_247237 [Xylona heveae TC161]
MTDSWDLAPHALLLLLSTSIFVDVDIFKLRTSERVLFSVLGFRSSVLGLGSWVLGLRF